MHDNNNNNRRRNFRPRPQKSNFRRRTGSMNTGSSNSLNNNGNMNFNRNGSMSNIHNVEKTMLKFQQLAKDAQTSGDPVLVENYLQHADHYLRRLIELNERSKDSSLVEKSDNVKNAAVEDKPITKDTKIKDKPEIKEVTQSSNK